VGRRPLNVRIPFCPIDHAIDPAGEGQGFCKDHSAKRKKPPFSWKVSQTPEKRRLDRSWYHQLQK
jgi:hypothetical protein